MNLHKPQRMEGESRNAYIERRKASNQAIKKLCRIFPRSTKAKDGRPYKRNRAGTMVKA